MRDRFRGGELLVVCHNYNTFVKSQVDPLAAAFDSVTVLVRHNPIAEVSEYVPIQWLKPYRKASTIDREETPANVRVEPTSLVYLPTDRGYERLGTRHARAVREQVKRLDVDPDLIHAHFTWTAGYAAVALKERYEVPVVLTVHANRDRFLREYTSGIPEVYETWRTVDRVIRVNRRDVPLLERYNDAVRAVPNGYSRERYRFMDTQAARSRLGIDPGTDVLFTLGTLKRRKGNRYLIEAMEHVVDERDDVLCAIGGQGAQLRALERQVSRRGLEEHVRVLGYVPEGEVDVWMNACDVFVLASLSEGNPTVMFEALGCGKPYVGTNVGGVSEVIAAGEHGLLCEPADPDALAKRLVEGLEREWNRSRIRAYAEQFTWDTIVGEVADIYAELLDERADRTPESRHGRTIPAR